MAETFLGNNNATPAGGGGASPAPAPAASPPPSTTSGGEGASPGAGARPDKAPAGAAPQEWAASLPEDVRGYIENKGWKEPGDVLKSYQQLEEFLGADKAGRGIVLPKDENDKEALDKIYNALGRPEKAEGYELTELMAKEETDPAFMEAAAAAMHEAGLSKVQAHKIATAYQGRVNAARQAAIEIHQREVVEAEKTLTPAEKEQCRRGFRFLGLSNEEAAAIEMYWGVTKAAKMFAKIGQALGEDTRVDGTDSGSGFGGSPEAAKARLAELDADPAFTKRYLEGEPTAVRLKEDLFKAASRRPGE